MSSHATLSEISLPTPSSSLEFYFQNRSLIKNIPLPYKLLSSSDYNDQIDEPIIPKNDTVTLDSGSNNMVNSFVGDVYGRNSSNNTQYSVNNRHLSESKSSSYGDQVAENKENKARIKRDSETSSQVNR
jgi:hypothetical protein